MHGTGNAPSNDLLDPDIQGLVERRLERHIDGDLNRVTDGGFVPRAVYLFANGAEGDVSPAWPPQSRCDVPTLVPLPTLAGPFTRSLWEWRSPTATHLSSCRHAAREAITVIGKSVGDGAVGRDGTIPSAVCQPRQLRPRCGCTRYLRLRQSACPWCSGVRRRGDEDRDVGGSTPVSNGGTLQSNVARMQHVLALVRRLLSCAYCVP